MSNASVQDRDTVERPRAADAVTHGNGMVLALAMPLVLKACSPPPPAHATTTSPTLPGGGAAVAGTAAGTGAAAQGATGDGAREPGLRAPQAPVVRISLGSYRAPSR